MARFVDDGWRDFVETELEQRKSDLFRIRMIVWLSFGLWIFAGTAIAFQVIYWYRNLLDFIPVVALAGLAIPVRLALQQYWGKVYPYFDFRTRGWVFRKTTFIGVRELTNDESTNIDEWLALNLRPDQYYESKYVASRLDFGRFFLFKDPKHAMLFKLAV
ncbi:hypothetical protein D3C71_991580 [compost metagenome]